MNPLEALQLVDQALGTIQADRSTHLQLQRAIAALTDTVTHAMSQPDDAPEEPEASAE